jgi:hypothetical protein
MNVFAVPRGNAYRSFGGPALLSSGEMAKAITLCGLAEMEAYYAVYM